MLDGRRQPSARASRTRDARWTFDTYRYRIAAVIGRTVRRARERARISQATLAKRARISQAYLSRLESGVQGNPSVAVLKRLAKALGVPVTAVLE
jgi:ribosome-binding protein aMBF1 (putative translation factor)